MVNCDLQFFSFGDPVNYIKTLSRNTSKGNMPYLCCCDLYIMGTNNNFSMNVKFSFSKSSDMLYFKSGQKLGSIAKAITVV